MRRAARRDLTEPEIVQTFKALGWSVRKLSQAGVDDLLVGRGAFIFLAECKTGKGKLTPAQIKHREEWRGPKPLIFRDGTDVLNFHNALLRS